MIERHFAAFLHRAGTHPLFPAFLSGQMHQEAVRSSDIVSRRHLCNLALYDEFLKPIGAEFQVGISLQLDDGGADVLILSRKSVDFSLNEKLRLTAFLPHVAAARKRAAPHPHLSAPSSQLTQKVDGRTHLLTRLQQELGLTCRESEILWWMTLGKSDADIATICDISRRTVEKHCENVYRKCGVENRTAAVIFALDRRF